MQPLDYFAENLSVLAQKAPALAEKIQHAAERIPPEAYPNSPDEPADFPLKLLTARNGSITARAKNPDGRWVQLHSAYDPEKEAGVFAESIKWDSANYNIVFGFGLGYIAEELAQRMRPTERMLIYEPSAEMLALTMQHRDIRKLITRPGTVLGVGESPQALIAQFMAMFSIASIRGLRMISFPAFEHLPGAHRFAELQEGIRAQMFAVGGNFQTLMAMGAAYEYNTLLSFRAILENPPFRNLVGRFKNIPAVLVATGPSLDKNVDLLHEIKDKALIIAVETSLKPLLKRGIEPHVVCTGDPQEANYRHIKGTFAPNTYLVVEPQAPPKSISEWTGRTFIASFGDCMMQWVEKVLGEVGRLKSWGSVATMAYDIALKCGADPIVFIGQDLSFPEGRTYAKGTYFEDEEKNKNTVEELREKGIYLIEKTDIYGKKVYTNKQMYSYCNYFHARFAEPEARRRRIINATEGGILKEGVQIMSFREAVSQYMVEPQPISALLEAAWLERPQVNLKYVEHETSAVLAELRELGELCRRGMLTSTKCVKAAQVAKERGTALSELHELNEFVQRLPKLHSSMSRLSRVIPFIQVANQTGLLAFKRRSSELATVEPSLELVIDLSTNYHTLFATCMEVASRLTPLFERARDSVLERAETEKAKLTA